MHNFRYQRLLAFSLLLLALPSFSGSAWGRAALVASIPTNGEVLSRAPGKVTLRFDNQIQPRLARFNISDVSGRLVLAMPAQRQPSAPSEHITVILPLLGRGSYILRYKVVDTAGETTHGSVSFTAGGY